MRSQNTLPQIETHNQIRNICLESAPLCCPWFVATPPDSVDLVSFAEILHETKRTSVISLSSAKQQQKKCGAPCRTVCNAMQHWRRLLSTLARYVCRRTVKQSRKKNKEKKIQFPSSAEQTASFVTAVAAWKKRFRCFPIGFCSSRDFLFRRASCGGVHPFCVIGKELRHQKRCAAFAAAKVAAARRRRLPR